MGSSRDEIGDILARELYLAAGLDPRRAPGAARVALATLGDDCLTAVPREDLPGHALLKRDGQRWVIYVRETLTSRQLNHAIAHELGEWILRCRHYSERDVEELSGAVAAAICVPRVAFGEAYALHGDDWKTLGARFHVSESLIALRCGECLGHATALVTSKVVRTRGKAWAWPDTREGWVRLVARTRERANGLTVRNLGDARERVVLRVR